MPNHSHTWGNHLGMWDHSPDPSPFSKVESLLKCFLINIIHIIVCSLNLISYLISDVLEEYTVWQTFTIYFG